MMRVHLLVVFLVGFVSVSEAFPPSLADLNQALKAPKGHPLEKLFAKAEDLEHLSTLIEEGKTCGKENLQPLGHADSAVLDELIHHLQELSSLPELKAIATSLKELGTNPTDVSCAKTFDEIKKFQASHPKDAEIEVYSDDARLNDIESFVELDLATLHTPPSRPSFLQAPGPASRRLLAALAVPAVKYHAGAYVLPPAVAAAAAWLAYVAGGVPARIKFGGKTLNTPPGGAFNAHDAKFAAKGGAHTGKQHVGKSFAQLCARACGKPLGVGKAVGGDCSSFTSWQQAALAIGNYYAMNLDTYVSARLLAKPKMNNADAHYPAPALINNVRSCYRAKAGTKAKGGYAKHVNCGGGDHCYCKAAAPAKITTVVRRGPPNYVLTHYPEF